MPRPKATNPTVLLKAMIPPELQAKMFLLLHSDVEGRIPHGKISAFVAERLREHFDWEELDLGLYGFAAGYFVRGPRPMIAALRFAVQQAHHAELIKETPNAKS